MMHMPLQPWQRQMIRYLFPHSAKRLRIEEAFMVKFPHIPRALFKYRDFGNPYHLDGLEKDEQWFSSPDKLNDPLDTVASFNTRKFPVQRKSIDEALAEVELIRQTEAAGEKWAPPKITDPIALDDYFEGVLDTLLDHLPSDDRRDLLDAVRNANEKLNDDLVNALSAPLRNGLGSAT